MIVERKVNKKEIDELFKFGMVFPNKRLYLDSEGDYTLKLHVLRSKIDTDDLIRYYLTEGYSLQNVLSIVYKNRTYKKEQFNAFKTN